jgi:urea transport system substrate-binding protein
MSADGGGAQRIALLGTDYVYPRTTNRILRGFLNSKGIGNADIMEEYTPFGHSDWQGIVARVKRFASEGKKTAIVSTINGDANVPFYRELGNQGIKAEDIPCVAFSVGEEELAGIDTRPLVGHLAAWNYFMSVQSPANTEFLNLWRAYIRNPRRVTNDPMEATYTGFNMWAQAVTQARSTAVDAVRPAVIGQKFAAPAGYTEEMLPNHHLSKPVMIGEIQADGQFNIVWKTPEVVPAENWSPFIPENANRRRG